MLLTLTALFVLLLSLARNPDDVSILFRVMRSFLTKPDTASNAPIFQRV